MREFNGKITYAPDGEHDEAIFLSDDPRPLAERLKFMADKHCTVRYWISDADIPKEQVQEAFVETLMGKSDVYYIVKYTEATGYLWTDERIVVGGHDLLNELLNNEDKWLFLEVEVN